MNPSMTVAAEMNSFENPEVAAATLEFTFNRISMGTITEPDPTPYNYIIL